MSIRTLVTPPISIDPAQILKASYRFTTWPNLDTVMGITNIFGDDYDYTVRMGLVENLTQCFNVYRPFSTAFFSQAFDDVIGSVTGEPTGDSDGATSIPITSQGAGVCNFDLFFDIDDGNMAGGIRSIAAVIVGGDTGSSSPIIQVEFSNRGEGVGALGSTIPKTATREITFSLAITWDRH
jgi:hypothetical protein